MPLTVFDCKEIPATRRERIEAAVETAGKSLIEPYEAWISADPFRGGVQVLITGRHGFERTVRFAIDEDPAVIRGAFGRRWRPSSAGHKEALGVGQSGGKRLSQPS
jgi:hypothetical protein